MRNRISTLEYTKIEKLPIEFVEQFKDKINWTLIGSGVITIFDELDEIPSKILDYIEKIHGTFGDYWFEEIIISYTRRDKLPLDFTERFNRHLFF